MDAASFFVDWLIILSMTLVLTQIPACIFCSFVIMVFKKKKSNHRVLLLFLDITNQLDALLVVVENYLIFTVNVYSLFPVP